MLLHANLKVMSVTPQQKQLHVLSNIPTRLTSSLARLITRCAGFVIAMHSCYHKPAGMYNIVMANGMGTHHFVPFLCSRSDILFLGMHSSSRSRTRDTTLIRGLNHGWNRTFITFVTTMLEPMETPTGSALSVRRPASRLPGSLSDPSATFGSRKWPSTCGSTSSSPSTTGMFSPRKSCRSHATGFARHSVPPHPPPRLHPSTSMHFFWALLLLSLIRFDSKTGRLSVHLSFCIHISQVDFKGVPWCVFFPFPSVYLFPI